MLMPASYKRGYRFRLAKQEIVSHLGSKKDRDNGLFLSGINSWYEMFVQWKTWFLTEKKSIHVP